MGLACHRSTYRITIDDAVCKNWELPIKVKSPANELSLELAEDSETP
jgi:hypothetical protein